MFGMRKKVKALICENEYIREGQDSLRRMIGRYCDDIKMLTNDNINLRQELEQLKVKYADEVKKNFELASYLSENKSD